MEHETSTTIYDFAKMMVNGKPPISKKKAKMMVREIARAMSNCPDMIFMMICPDLRQYVVFEMDFDPIIDSVYKDLLEVLENRGTILDIDDSAAEQEIWEIWIRDKYDNKIYMYQLTNYDEFVVRLG